MSDTGEIPRIVLSKGSEPTFGGTLVDRDGIQYEGCAWLEQYWGCDYATRRQVSGWHYEQGHYVLNVFWSWQKYTSAQAGCAAARPASGLAPPARRSSLCSRTA